jgi:Na+/H+-dicarboxylate symporter
MTFNAQLSIVFITWITSFGIAGIPSGCLVALMIVLHSLGISNEAIGLIIGFDRILDMFRTVCNIFANICSSVIVAYSDGQELKI